MERRPCEISILQRNLEYIRPWLSYDLGGIQILVENLFTSLDPVHPFGLSGVESDPPDCFSPPPLPACAHHSTRSRHGNLRRFCWLLPAARAAARCAERHRMPFRRETPLLGHLPAEAQPLRRRASHGRRRRNHDIPMPPGLAVRLIRPLTRRLLPHLRATISTSAAGPSRTKPGSNGELFLKSSRRIDFVIASKSETAPRLRLLFDPNAT